MSDDWSTVNVRREKMTRELEVLRQRYRTHRDAIAGLIEDAPSEALAKRYEEMIAEIDRSLEKLSELDSPQPSPRRTAPGTGPQPLRSGPAAGAAVATATATTGAVPQPAPNPTQPGGSTAKSWDSYSVDRSVTTTPPTSNSPVRALAIVLAGIALVALLGFFAWRALSGDEEAEAPPIVREETAGAVTATEEPDTSPGETPATSAAPVTVTPSAQDYGIVKKGTRASRTFQIRNATGGPVALQMARSRCRCLWFEFPDQVAANDTATLTVIVDGAKAGRGPLRETIAVTANENPAVKASLQVVAEIE